MQCSVTWTWFASFRASFDLSALTVSIEPENLLLELPAINLAGFMKLAT